jgi:DNA-binding phage protein
MAFLSLELIMDQVIGCTLPDRDSWCFFYFVAGIKGASVKISFKLNNSGLTIRGAKMPTSRSYHTYLIESLQDPQEAAAYLDAVLEDGNFEEIRSALTQIAEAQMCVVASDTTIAAHRKAIYEILAQPTQLDSSVLLNILNDLGFRISVAAKGQAA